MVTSSTPIKDTVPCATMTQVSPVSPDIRITPMRASDRSTPVANGLISPFSSFAEPWPIKICSPSPAKTLRLPLSTKLTLPSMVTKFAIVMVRSETEKANRSPSDSLNRITMERPFISMVSSTAPPVLLIRRMMLPLPSTDPTPTAAVPERRPAIPVLEMIKPPSPSESV